MSFHRHWYLLFRFRRFVWSSGSYRMSVKQPSCRARLRTYEVARRRRRRGRNIYIYIYIYIYICDGRARSLLARSPYVSTPRPVVLRPHLCTSQDIMLHQKSQKCNTIGKCHWKSIGQFQWKSTGEVTILRTTTLSNNIMLENATENPLDHATERPCRPAPWLAARGGGVIFCLFKERTRNSNSNSM